MAGKDLGPMRVVWQGVDYGEAPGTLKTGEIIRVERALGGVPMEEWSSVVGAMAMIFATVRRKDADAITWEQLEALDLDELNDMLIEVEKPAGGKAGEAGGADPLGGGSPARRSSSGSRGGARKAAARTRSAARTTSST